jgi:nitrite reductase/ring-hydroxylating ferredoxin subunit
LKTVGNALTVVGGHAGIIIYRLSQTDFIAFDRLCPHEQDVSCRLEETNDNLVYTCECCNTPYMLLDGTGQARNDSIFPGTGKFLKEYRADFDGISNLRISNF